MLFANSNGRETRVVVDPLSYDIAIMRIVLMFTLSLAGCGMPLGDKGGDDAEDAPPIPVKVEPVTRGEIVAAYYGTGVVETDFDARVVAKVNGEVREVLVEEGDSVRAGQVLARLNGDRLWLEVKQSGANLKKAQEDYRRNVELHEKGLVSATAFEGIKYDVDALKAAYDRAVLELSYTEIRSSIGGIVSARHIKVGHTIEPNVPVFEITNLDALLAYLHIPEREVGKLQPGQDAEVSMDALPGNRFVGRIVRISPVVDAQTGTFRATIEIVDPTGQVRPGMFGRFNIVYDRHTDALLIPTAALLDAETETAVFVVNDDMAHRRVIETGFSSNGNTEVTKGLTENAKIVTIGQGGLKDGAKVVVAGASSP